MFVIATQGLGTAILVLKRFLANSNPSDFIFLMNIKNAEVTLFVSWPNLGRIYNHNPDIIRRLNSEYIRQWDMPAGKAYDVETLPRGLEQEVTELIDKDLQYQDLSVVLNNDRPKVIGLIRD